MWRTHEKKRLRRFSGRDPRYAGLSPADLPLTECLKDTVARFLHYWHGTIAPAVAAGRKVLIAAHGNSLRALVKCLDGISDQAIVELNIPTGMPLVYELDANLKPVNRYYLGDPEKVKAAMEAVAAQGRRSNAARFFDALVRRRRGAEEALIFLFGPRASAFRTQPGRLPV